MDGLGGREYHSRLFGAPRGPLLDHAPDFDTLTARFRWQVPSRYNIAESACERWARETPDRPAILAVQADDRVDVLTFGALSRASNRLANVLRERDVRRGDRVAIIVPQGHTAVIAHMAIYKLGAVALPLAVLFGVDALEFRLADAGAKVAILTNAAGRRQAAGEIRRPALPALADHHQRSTAPMRRRVERFDEGAGARPSEDFAPVDTGPDDPAMMIYTSGTTGPAKGRAPRPPRARSAICRASQLAHEFLPRPGDRLWTPADWAWAGGLLNVLLPACISACRCSPTASRSSTRRGLPADGAPPGANAFIPPTALRMMRPCSDPRRERYALSLRSRRRRPARASGPRPTTGAGGLRHDRQRVLRPDRVQSRASAAPPSASSPAGLHRQARARPRGSRSSGPDGSTLRAGGDRPDRRAPARSGDVPRLLEQAPRPRPRSSSATG
jgi:acetyl-CoA synthetase